MSLTGSVAAAAADFYFHRLAPSSFASDLGKREKGRVTFFLDSRQEDAITGGDNRLRSFVIIPPSGTHFLYVTQTVTTSERNEETTPSFY